MRELDLSRLLYEREVLKPSSGPAFSLEFKMKIGDKEDVVARILMSPDEFMELAEMIDGVLEGFEGARIPQEEEDNMSGD